MSGNTTPTTRILVYDALLLFLRRACTENPGCVIAGQHDFMSLVHGGPILSEVSRLRTTLDRYQHSMAFDQAVEAIVQSSECRKTLLQVSSELGLTNDPKLRAALRTDAKRIAALLVSIFNSRNAEKTVLRLEGDSAQSFLDVVQSTLDKGLLINQQHSRMARRIIRKLCESCDKLPSSLFIGGVSRQEERPTFGGGYGDIYRASYGNKIVALKHMRAVHFMRGTELRRIRLKFCREALVWKDLHHPHILPFLGIDQESFPPSLCMVSPWMEHGTVMNYLKEHGHANVDKLLYEIAQGLEYLHWRGIVHGDLRGANILITEDWTACLADFGLSNFSDATASTTSNRAGSSYWMAPELLDPNRFGYEFARTPASDVYAFACVCLELYTGRPPFMNLHQTAALMKIINGERPERPSGFPAMSDLLWQHVTACWVDNPTARPLTAILVQNLVWPTLEPQSLHFLTLSATAHTESAILSARNLDSSPLVPGRDEPVSLFQSRQSRTNPPIALPIPADSGAATEFGNRTQGRLVCGPRGSGHGPSDFLWLDEDTTSSSCESPPSPTLSLSPDDGPRVFPRESAMREQRWLGLEFSRSTFLYPAVQNRHIRGASPLEGPIFLSNRVARFPAIASSFSATYHNDYAEHNAAVYGVDDDIPLYSIYFPMKPGGQMDELVTHYLRDVIHLQYALFDTNQIQDILCPSVTSPGSARDAAQLLAAIHKKHSTYRSCMFVALRDEDIGSRYNELMQVLHKPYRNEDDALAAISMIWSVLFDGGRGPWQDWLAVLYEYTDHVFRNCDPRDTLQNCDETTRFIIKTTIWFDVLAAVTTQKTPRFLTYIRQLYSPEVHDLTLPPSPELSMLSVVGCENHIVWALAEASALAVWKRQQQRRGYLSVPELVARADRLDKMYLNAMAPKLHGTDTDLARELSSNIFRAVTRVYVRSTVSGDFPHVPEINEAIEETIAYVRTSAEHSQKVYSSVVRSTVFAFFICGALTGDRNLQQEVITAHCSWGQDASLSTVGTIGPIRKLLEKIWHDRANKPRYAAVPWQVNLREVNMLLA
ncbi:hypothetical protein DFH06DRAFT_1487185 [Mycena polygramma]|nr:hypothetical protein DFH06DRAFT_1487185 [Mycena polygramma]